MNYKAILEDNGFVWSEHQELYVKSMGFGRKITVWMFMKGLFIIKEGNKVILDDYIMSKDQFISTIKKL
mgnify:FL=1|tara:strand:+ start:246 stop:452 length:207 start_codon:yes stop_codon:yes gene_type:complete